MPTPIARADLGVRSVTADLTLTTHSMDLDQTAATPTVDLTPTADMTRSPTPSPVASHTDSTISTQSMGTPIVATAIPRSVQAVVAFPRPNGLLSYNIDQFEPGTIRAVTAGMKAGQGTSALWILEVEQSGCFVLKIDSMVANEHYTSEYFGKGFGRAAVPKTRLLDKSEYVGAIGDMFVKFSNARNLTELRHLKFMQELWDPRNTHILLMEYKANAKTIKDVNALARTGADYGDLFNGGAGRVRLFYLGMLAAYDLVISNNDRLPGIVTQGFNTGNLMIDRGGDSVAMRPLPIDNTTSQNTPESLERFRQDARRREQPLANNVKEGFNLDDVLSDRTKLRDLASLIVARLPVDPAAGRDPVTAVANGIREGLWKLATDDNAAVRELQRRMQEASDWARYFVLGKSLEILAAKGQALRS